MDCDGEDAPEHIPMLLAAHRRDPDAIIVARRARRSEGFAFRLLYRLYKLIFRLLIGSPITFGNFALIPASRLKRLLVMPELWNHLAATYIKSRVPLRSVLLPRGQRYAGVSRMNWPGLIVHGLSAIAVFSDLLVARVLVASVLLLVVSILGVLAVMVVRFGTNLAIAGWATNAVGLLVIVSLQSSFLSLLASFLVLNGRTQIPMSLLSEFDRFTQSHRATETGSRADCGNGPCR
jgi:hypothetical protein